MRRLALFGSAARDDFDPAHSALDFLVEFEALPAGTYARTYFGLLEALRLLFGRRVDLVEEARCAIPISAKKSRSGRRHCMRRNLRAYLWDIEQAANNCSNARKPD